MVTFSIATWLAAFSVVLSGFDDSPFKGVSPPPVNVEFKTNEQLCAMQFADKCTPDSSWDFAAIYTLNTIHLNVDCDYNNDVYCQSVLLHELVHHYQAYSDVDYILKCDVDPVAPKEFEAYKIQIKWLEDQEVDPWKFLDGLSVMGASSCPVGGNSR